MPDFPDTSGHLHSDNHVKTGIFPHNYPSRLRKYNILLHITYVRRSLNRYILVIMSMRDKFKSNFGQFVYFFPCNSVIIPYLICY